MAEELAFVESGSSPPRAARGRGQIRDGATERSRPTAAAPRIGAAGAEGRLLRPCEVQQILGLGRSRVYELIASGAFPVVRLGSRTTRVPEDGLRRYIEQQTTQLKAA